MLVLTIPSVYSQNIRERQKKRKKNEQKTKSTQIFIITNISHSIPSHNIPIAYENDIEAQYFVSFKLFSTRLKITFIYLSTWTGGEGILLSSEFTVPILSSFLRKQQIPVSYTHKNNNTAMASLLFHSFNSCWWKSWLITVCQCKTSATFQRLAAMEMTNRQLSHNA